MKKKAQAPNVFPSQSVEDYVVNGPSKVETSDERFFQDQDTRFILDFMSVKDKYNELRQEGKTHGQAWRDSNAYTMSLERQMLMKNEIEEKNPGFYVEENAKPLLVSKAAEIRLKGGTKWNAVYTNEDIGKLAKSFSKDENVLKKLSASGLSKECIKSALMVD